MNREKKSPYANLEKLQIELPPPPQKLGLYLPCNRYRELLWISGQGPFLNEGREFPGKVGDEVTIEAAQKAAREAALNALAVVEEYQGLDKVEKILKVVGYVNAAPTFTSHPQVIDGASELFTQIFEDRGFHSRTAIGVNSLPLNIPVEIDVLFQLAK